MTASLRGQFFIDDDRLNFKASGNTLYRRMLSEEQFGIRLGRLFSSNSCLYLLFSPGLGYGLSWLLHNPLPEGSVLAVFETDEALFPFFQADDSQQLLNVPKELANTIHRQHVAWKELRSELCTRQEIIFCPAQDRQAQLHWLQEQLLYADDSKGGLFQRLRRVRGLRFCGRAEHADLLEDTATRLIQQGWQNHSTAVFMSHLWIRNAFANSLRSPGTLPLSSLKDILGNDTVVLCGAGTGLEAVLDDIREQENCTVAAVDTAVPTLIECGIVPRIIFMVEGQFANMDDFICSSALRRLKDSLLIYDLLAHPPTVKLFPLRAAFVSRFARSTFFAMLPQGITSIPPLGSVGPAALYILLRYSNASVRFCGFDFAFPAGAPTPVRHRRISAYCAPAHA